MDYFCIIKNSPKFNQLKRVTLLISKIFWPTLANLASLNPRAQLGTLLGWSMFLLFKHKLWKMHYGPLLFTVHLFARFFISAIQPKIQSDGSVGGLDSFSLLLK